MGGFEPATSRLTVEVTHVFTTGKLCSFLGRDVACCVTTKLSDQAANAGSKSQTGNNRPKCSGPPFWLETTALEMPAGFFSPPSRQAMETRSSPPVETFPTYNCCQ